MLGVLGQSRATLFCFVLCSLFTAQQASGEFSTIINIPPDPDFEDNRLIGSDVQLNLSDGGTIGSLFQAGEFDGTSTNVEVNVTGGTIGFFFYTFSGSTVNVSGGSIGSFFQAGAFHGASTNVEVNVSGGSIGNSFEAFGGSTVNISGGSFGAGFDASSGSTVNLFGTQFEIEDNDITASLTPNVPFTIYERNVTLTSLLADGSSFSLDLNSTDESGEDYFDFGALLSVTLIQPGDFDGDFDDDGDVDGDDFLELQQGLGTIYDATDLADWEANYDVTPGDFDIDGDVDGADFLLLQQGLGTLYDASDLAAWESNYGTPLSTTSTTVPEPTGSALLLMSLVCVTFQRRSKSRSSVGRVQR